MTNLRLISAQPIENQKLQSTTTAMSLSSEQKRIIKQHAGPLFPSPTPVWSEIGEDDRKKLLQQLLARLRETSNTGIADTLEKHPELCWPILQQKVKSLRWGQRKSTALT